MNNQLSESILQKRIKRFKSIKRGYYSLIAIVIFYVLSLLSPLWINNQALMVYAKNNKWDPGEPLTDISNGKWDDAEEFIDLNNNEIWDEGEEFVDLNNNEIWDDTEEFIDTPNGVWDSAEYYTDVNFLRKKRLEGQAGIELAYTALQKAENRKIIAIISTFFL